MSSTSENEPHASALSGGVASGSSGGNSPWGWLGLLKWSLQYSDGTDNSSRPSPMSAEDREFLEKVMKEGIIDENERMKTVLKEVTKILSLFQIQSGDDMSEEDMGTVTDLLEELRFIVEQIDYARAFASLQGLPFLLGMIAHGSLPSHADFDGETGRAVVSALPLSIRAMSAGIIATMSQHNPPVQKELLELGALKTLTESFLDTNNQRDPEGLLRAKLMQAISATVRSHSMAESVFMGLEQSQLLIASGLGFSSSSSEDDERLPPAVVRRRTLFFLRALITSDYIPPEKLHSFSPHIVYLIDSYVLLDHLPSGQSIEDDQRSFCEFREMTLSLLRSLLENRVNVNAVLTRQNALVGRGVSIIPALREQQQHLSESKSDDYHDPRSNGDELEHWEQILTLLSNVRPEDVPPNEPTNEEPSPLMLTSGSLR